jgi:hypothetical protein
MIAATLRPTAVAAANEKSEIHIIGDIPLSVSDFAGFTFRAGRQRGPRQVVPGIMLKIR